MRKKIDSFLQVSLQTFDFYVPHPSLVIFVNIRDYTSEII